MNKKTLFCALAVLVVGLVFAESELIENYLKSDDVEPTTFNYNGMFYKIVDDKSVWLTHGTITSKLEQSYDNFDYPNYNGDNEYDYTYDYYRYWDWDYYSYENDKLSEYYYHDYFSSLFYNDYTYTTDDYWFEYNLRSDYLNDYFNNSSYFYYYNRIYNFYGGKNEKAPRGKVVIPEKVKFEGREYTVTGIGSHAFSNYFSYDMTKGCDITSIVIPKGIEHIAYDAFEGCTEIESIVWNAVACKDLDEVFAYSEKSVKTITFGNSVEHIPSNLCYNMENIKEIAIPYSVTSIGYYAFNGCKRLHQITCNAQEPPTMVRNSFSEYAATVSVPCEFKSGYTSDAIWGAFKQIQCDGAEELYMNSEDVIVEEETYSIEIAFPKVEKANTYTLTVKKNNTIVCQLVFDESGVLLNIAFSNTRLKNEVVGFKYKIDGLEAGTLYTYEIQAQDENKNVLKRYDGFFVTKDSAVGIDDLSEGYTVSVVNKTIQILSDKNTSISIFDLQGKCLYRNNNTMEAVVSVPQTGVYAVKIGGNQQIVVVR